MQYIPYIYDGIAVVIIIAGAVLGAKRGLLRTVIGVIFTAAAFIGAAYLSSDSICSQVYDRYIKEKALSVVSEAMITAEQRVKDSIAEKAKDTFGKITDEHTDEDTSNKLKDMFSDFIDEHREDIDHTVSTVADKLGVDVGKVLENEEITKRVDEAAELYSHTAAAEINTHMPLGITVEPVQIKGVISDKKLIELFIDETVGLNTDKTGFDGTAEYIEETILRPLILRAVHILLWIAAFIVIKLVLSLIMAVIMALKRSVPVIEGTDALCGCLMGLVGGLALAAFLAAAASALIALTGGMTWVNDDIISQTYIFGFLYDMVGGIESLLTV